MQQRPECDGRKVVGYGGVGSLFDAVQMMGEGEDAQDVGVVVGRVEVGLGHVGADEGGGGIY